jgi:hypothetical protein
VISTSPAYHDHLQLTRFYEFAINRICRTFRTLSRFAADQQIAVVGAGIGTHG